MVDLRRRGSKVNAVAASKGNSMRSSSNNSMLMVVGVFVLILLAALRMNGDGGARADQVKGEAMAEEGGGGSATLGVAVGAVRMPPRDGAAGYDLPYLHCGPEYGSGSGGGREIVLLHGAAFKKENWRDSGILEGLCEKSKGRSLSVTALDLDVKVDGAQLGDAFDALSQRGVTSGDPAAFVSPSASGKAMVHLGQMASSSSETDDGRSKLLTRLVRSWIPVACPSVRGADEKALGAYKVAGIPILAVHGTKDIRGKETTKRLVKVAGAEELEIEGGHPCYLDSPDAFVRSVLKFVGI